MAQEYNTNDSLEISRTISLDSVVVTGRSPQVRTKGDATKIQVANSVLAKMGNVSTMLAHTPGMHTENNQIIVNGLGEPIFVLDGRILKSTEALTTLQADNIKTIEIDRSPSVEYSAEGRPVVKITTIKHVNDYVFLNIGNYMQQTRKFSEMPMLNFRTQFKKVSMSFSYAGGENGAMNKETYFRKIYHSDGDVFNIKMRRNDPYYIQGQRMDFALDYNIDKSNRLGVYYLYVYNRVKNPMEGTDFTGYGNELDEKSIERTKIGRGNMHNISVQYAYKKDRQAFTLTQDMVFNAKRNHGLTREMSKDYYQEYTNNGQTDYSSASTNAKYSFRLPWKINTYAGARFNYVRSMTNSLSDATFVMEGKYKNRVRLIERAPEAYISMTKRLGRFTVSPSFTYQYVHRQVSNGGGTEEIKREAQHYSSIIPSITVKYEPNDAWNFSLNYRNYLTQPSFSQINAGLAFEDSLSYTVGNATLRATRINRLNFSMSWNDLSLNMRYLHQKDPIVNVETLTSAESNIIMSSSTNFPCSSNMSMGLSYSHTFKKLTVYAEAEGILPKGEYMYLGKTYQADKMSFDGQLNLNYMFSPAFFMFIDYTHQGRSVYLTKKQKAVDVLNIGFTASLLKNRLEAYLAFTDVFGKGNYNNLTYRYDNIESGTYGKNDSRGVTLRLSYTLFNKKINVKTTNQNQSIINRM